MCSSSFEKFTSICETLLANFLGLYETPGGKILRHAHIDIETLTMDKVHIALDC